MGWPVRSNPRALVVGWKIAFSADKQGTPVQTRDGPAAVTRQLTHVAFCLPLLLKALKKVFNGEKALGDMRLGSQKTYQRV